MKKLIFSLMVVIGLSSFMSPGILPKIKKVENQSIVIVPTEKVSVVIIDENNNTIHNQVIKTPTKFNLSHLEDGKYKIQIKTDNTIIEEREVVLKTETKRSLN